MTISLSIPFLIFIIIAIIIVSATTTYYFVRQKKQKKERKVNNTPSIIQVYRDKEQMLRVWYSVIAGMDTFLLCISILSNAIAIILSQFQDVSQNTIIIFMILTLLSSSIRSCFNFPELRKP